MRSRKGWGPQVQSQADYMARPCSSPHHPPKSVVTESTMYSFSPHSSLHFLAVVFCFIFALGDKILLCSSLWIWTHRDPSASTENTDVWCHPQPEWFCDFSLCDVSASSWWRGRKENGWASCFVPDGSGQSACWGILHWSMALLCKHSAWIQWRHLQGGGGAGTWRDQASCSSTSWFLSS